jgi:hypothetical protein
VLEGNKVGACSAFGRGALHAGEKAERRRNLLASARRQRKVLGDELRARRASKTATPFCSPVRRHVHGEVGIPQVAKGSAFVLPARRTHVRRLVGS